MVTRSEFLFCASKPRFPVTFQLQLLADQGEKYVFELSGFVFKCVLKKDSYDKTGNNFK